MPFLLTILAVASVSFAGLVSTFGQDEYSNAIAPISLSADGRFGVTVPTNETDDHGKAASNNIVEAKTGHVIGAIEGAVALAHMNHDTVMPTCWTTDDSTLLWQVDGKWGIATIKLINLKNGKIAQQVDVLDLLQKEILKRTRTARPKDYAAVKREGEGDGSWFKDGFAIDVVLDVTSLEMKFPISARVFLTSNVKDASDATNLDSRLNAEINGDGTIKVTKFYLGQEPPARDWGY